MPRLWRRIVTPSLPAKSEGHAAFLLHQADDGAPASVDAPSGYYSFPRKCFHCEFETLSRDEFWAHVIQTHGMDE